MNVDYDDYFDTFKLHSTPKQQLPSSNILSDSEMCLQSKTQAKRNQWKKQMREENYSYKINKPKDKIRSTQVSEIEIETKVFIVEIFYPWN
jgi:hypothetical protein